jgi:hypothetical protein
MLKREVAERRLALPVVAWSSSEAAAIYDRAGAITPLAQRLTALVLLIEREMYTVTFTFCLTLYLVMYSFNNGNGTPHFCCPAGQLRFACRELACPAGLLQ